MTADEIQIWSERSVRSHAEEVARATGESFDDVHLRAQRHFFGLLPTDHHAERTWLLMILDDSGADVGALWIGPHPDRADAVYIYDIEINEAHRGRGLGRAAMVAAEALARDAGCQEIGLTVDGYNATARQLYDSLGYRVDTTRMIKTIHEAPSAPARPT
jgi:ribosomal protein S18 acetylase RimI-like enzyme